jgi:glutathione S-transferase
MTEIKLYGFPPSTYTQTALMLAHEAGVDVRLTPLDFKKPSHFALHPYGKMPVLEHGEVTLFETLAIAVYLDHSFGKQRLQPTDSLAQARMLQWISVAIDYAYEDLVGKLHEDKPAAEALAAAGEQLKLLDAGLGKGPYFAGETLSLADFFLYPMVCFAKEKLSESRLSGLPALARWHAELQKRPAARKAA